jgi:pimeloyl-ACP methyl ester carboxylesterase
MRVSNLILVFGLFFYSSIHAQDLTYHQVITRDGAKQGFAFQQASDPVASAVLFQGGDGRIGAFGSERKGWVRLDGAFLSGGPSRFADTGISAAAFDTPSDRRNLNSGVRSTIEHAQDTAAVMEFLRKRAPGKPVCLIGTSNGSLSAATGAALITDRGPDCIVLTSSVTVKPKSTLIARFAHVFTDADLSKIKVPVLIVHHKNDLCEHTPYAPMLEHVKSFPNSPKVDFITIEGGQDHPDNCNRGHHQFLGIEREVTAQIADWIKSLGK